MKLKFRLIIALVAIISTFIVAKVGTDYLAKPANKVETVVLTKDIKKGDRIDQSMINITQMSVDAINTNTITNQEDILGKYALVDLFHSDLINKNHVSNNADTFENYVLSMTEGKHAVAITVNNLSASVAARLQRGDIVSVFGSIDKKDIYFPELQYVKVIGVFNTLGNENIGITNYSDRELLPANIVLEVNPEQAQLLVEMEQSRGVHFVHVARVNDEIAEHYLTLQEQYFYGN